MRKQGFAGKRAGKSGKTPSDPPGAQLSWEGELNSLAYQVPMDCLEPEGSVAVTPLPLCEPP